MPGKLWARSGLIQMCARLPLLPPSLPRKPEAKGSLLCLYFTQSCGVCFPPSFSLQLLTWIKNIQGGKRKWQVTTAHWWETKWDISLQPWLRVTYIKSTATWQTSEATNCSSSSHRGELPKIAPLLHCYHKKKSFQLNLLAVCHSCKTSPRKV